MQNKNINCAKLFSLIKEGTLNYQCSRYQDLITFDFKQYFIDVRLFLTNYIRKQEQGIYSFSSNNYTHKNNRKSSLKDSLYGVYCLYLLFFLSFIIYSLHSFFLLEKSHLNNVS